VSCEALDRLGRPKVLLLSSDEPTVEVDLQESSLQTRVEEVTRRIERAHFIGGHDLPKVIRSYKDYVDRMGKMLTTTLPLLQAAVGESTQPRALPPLPVVGAPPAPRLQLAAGQMLLVLSEEDLYGYAVMKAVEEQSGGRIRPEIGSLYRVLARLLDDGLVEEADPPHAEVHPGRRRRYYHLTERGREAARTEAVRLSEVLEVARDADLLADAGR